MGLFDKFKKKQNEKRNEINNEQLKEYLANNALALLKRGDDYERFDNTLCEFGYLFDFDGHGLEALFKITTDKAVYYFAAQKSSLMRIEINEELFKSTTDTFLSMHQ